MSDYSDDVQETYADNLAAETKNASSGGIGALAEHIAALAGTACEIDQAFFNIEATFESVVQENPTGAFKDDVESLQTKWKKKPSGLQRSDLAVTHGRWEGGGLLQRLCGGHGQQIIT